jgi:hypothetical protein
MCFNIGDIVVYNGYRDDSSKTKDYVLVEVSFPNGKYNEPFSFCGIVLETNCEYCIGDYSDNWNKSLFVLDKNKMREKKLKRILR